MSSPEVHLSTGGDWPLVSVVLPTRGRPELVRKAIAGVVNQTYAGPIECVVVHDREPPDHSLSELGSSTRPVSVISNNHTPGLAGARNAGLDQVRGSFIASCDDDDVWHPRKLELQMHALITRPDVLVMGAGLRLLLPGGRIVDWPGRAATITHHDLLRSRYKELHSSTLLMRKEAFTAAGGYDEQLPFSYAEDYEWLLRVSRHGGIGVVIEPLADIKKDGASWFSEGQSVVAAALEYLLSRHPEFATCRPGEARVLGQIAFAHASLGNRRTALNWAGRAFRRTPRAPHAALALAVAAGLQPRFVVRAAEVFGRGVS